MTNGQNSNFNIGSKNQFQIDFSKLKSGIKAEEFKDNAAMLDIFNTCDTNKNSVLDQNEISLFVNKLQQAAGDDATLDDSEAGRLLKQEQRAQVEAQRASGLPVTKTKLKAQDLYDFTQKLQNWSNTTNVRSSVVDGDKRIVSYEDGGQEVINKDGSKVVTTISGSVKTVKTLNKDGKVEKEETVDEENGIVETIIYGEDERPVSYSKRTETASEEIQYDEDGRTIKSHTVTTDNAKYEIGTEGFANGKVVKEITGSGDEQQVAVYNYTGENDFTKTLTYKDTETITTVNDGKVVNIDATQYDDNHNKVQSVVIAEDGTQTVSLYKDNNVVYDAVTDPNGRLTETRYNAQGRRLSQQITNTDGRIQLAEYDGNGNTIVVVQNGETIGSMGSKFHRTTSQLTAANRGHVYKDANGNSYFLVGDQVSVPGEFPANHRGLQHRNGAAQEIAEYTAQEEQRVMARLQGKEQKAITVDRDYANWYRFAEDQLKSEGIQNPTKQQINDRTNELLILNPNVEIPKKGSKIVAIKTAAEIQAERLQAQQQHAKDVRRGVVNDMVEDFNKAQRSFDLQMKKDGWAADVADAVSYIWNNDWWSATGNTARQVRQDLADYRNKLEGLRTAYRTGEPEFKAQFKETFGIEYNQQNVEAYNAKREKLESVATAVATEKAVTARMDALFANYDREKRAVDNNRSALVDERGMYAAQFAVQNEIQNLLGLSNEDMFKLSERLRSEGKSLDIDYMRSLYGDIKKGLAQNTREALGGKTIGQYEAEMNAAYKKAYGNRTDIVKRVADYNSSQDTGAAVVKTTTKIVGSAVIAAATGGTASGLLIAAVGSSALSFTVDATDMMSDGMTHSASEYTTAAKNAAIDGAGQLVSGGMSKVLKASEVGRVARYTVQAATDVGVDLTSEYLQTGEMHLSTAVTSALASVGGEALGDFLEARAARKQFDLGDVDEAALAREYGSVDSGWLGGPNPTGTEMSEGARIAQLNPAHSRYQYTVSADQMGGVKTQDLGGGFSLVTDDPGHISVDISANQRRAIRADVASLGVRGSEFIDGLETLEAVQVARTSYTPRADGVVDYAATQGLGQRGSGVATRSAVTAPGREDWRAGAGMREDVYQTLSQRGVIGDSQLVEDCGNLAGKAYGGDKAYNGWNVLTDSNGNSLTTDLPNGFHAKAYEKDGRIVVAFRGSDDAADLASDFAMLSGRTPQQLEDAVAFVDRIKAQYPDANIVVTGHSLGGSLTEMVASRYEDVVGITFDAVGTKGIVEATGGALKDNHNTVNYIVHGDVISNADAHVGQVVVVSNITKGNELLSPHAIGNFMGNSSALEGVESGILARHVDVNTSATRLSDIIAQSADGPVTLDKRQFRGIAESFEYDVNTIGADLNALEAQISHIADPAQRVQLQGMIDSRRVAITSGTDIKANTNTLRTLSGDEVNDVLCRDYGFTEPGFLGGDTPSAEIVTREPTKFVRVYNDESSFSRGTWLMPYDEVVGKTPAEIKDFYALPAMPKYIVEVEVPAGTKMFTGKCNPLEGWGNGGGTQFFITDNFEIPTRFENKRLIPGATN